MNNQPSSRFSSRSAFLGGAAGVGVALLVGMLLSPLLQYWIESQGVSVDNLFATMAGSLEMNVAGHCLDVFGGVIGGHLAARLANARPLTHGAASSLPALIALSVQYLGLFPSPYPVWSQLLSFATPLPAGFIGGLLFYWKRRSEQA